MFAFQVINVFFSPDVLFGNASRKPSGARSQLVARSVIRGFVCR